MLQGLQLIIKNLAQFFLTLHEKEEKEKINKIIEVLKSSLVTNPLEVSMEEEKANTLLDVFTLEKNNRFKKIEQAFNFLSRATPPALQIIETGFIGHAIG